MKPPLGMLVHTHKVMPILSSVLVLIGFSDLKCRDQPQGHPTGPSAPSGCPLSWFLHTRCKNPIRTRLPQVLLHFNAPFRDWSIFGLNKYVTCILLGSGRVDRKGTNPSESWRRNGKKKWMKSLVISLSLGMPSLSPSIRISDATRQRFQRCK